jgi:hypothetical protein
MSHKVESAASPTVYQSDWSGWKDTKQEAKDTRTYQAQCSLVCFKDDKEIDYNDKSVCTSYSWTYKTHRQGDLKNRKTNTCSSECKENQKKNGKWAKYDRGQLDTTRGTNGYKEKEVEVCNEKWGNKRGFSKSAGGCGSGWSVKQPTDWKRDGTKRQWRCVKNGSCRMEGTGQWKAQCKCSNKGACATRKTQYQARKKCSCTKKRAKNKCTCKNKLTEKCSDPSATALANSNRECTWTSDLTPLGNELWDELDATFQYKGRWQLESSGGNRDCGKFFMRTCDSADGGNCSAWSKEWEKCGNQFNYAEKTSGKIDIPDGHTHFQIRAKSKTTHSSETIWFKDFTIHGHCPAPTCTYAPSS